MAKPIKDRPRLGRGLNSLISVPDFDDAPIPAVEDLVVPALLLPPVVHPGYVEYSEPQPPPGPPTSGMHEVLVASIAPNPHQPRRAFDEASLQELAASLKSTGLVQPVAVRLTGNHYELIAGERRWRAAKLAGLKTIPAVVRNVDSITQAQMALVENIQRQDLNPIERAEAYHALMSQLGLTQVELATRLGEDRSSIANFLRLLDLTAPVRAHLTAGRLSMGHAKLLAGITDGAEQERLAELVVAQELSVRNLERILTASQAEVPTPADPSPASAHLQDLEKSLASQLGMRVQVRAGSQKGRGRMVIHYSSLDQFDELLSRLGVKVD